MRGNSFISSILLCIVTLLAVACSSDENSPEHVANAAKQYYDQLLEGKHDAFVDGSLGSKGIPHEYRQQLIVNAQQFLEEMKEDRNGLISVRATGAKVNATADTADAFLMLCFGDSTNEEVVVPMVRKEGKWLMR